MQNVLATSVPAVAMLAGLATSLLLGASIRPATDKTDAALVNQFEQLTSTEQQRMLNNARTLRELEDKQPSEWNRIQNLHSRVNEDPNFRNRLTAFRRWWLKLSTPERRQLKNPDGTFVEDWVETAEGVHADTTLGDEYIIVTLAAADRGRGQPRPESWRFTEQDFVAFLDAAISPEPMPLTTRLQTLDGDCEKTLTKTLWLLHKIAPPQLRFRSRWTEEGEVSLQAVQQTLVDYLAADDMRNRLRRSMKQGGRREHARAALATVRVFQAALSHFEAQFREKHINDTNERLVALYARLDRDRQLKLMRDDSATVKDTLQTMLIEELDNDDPAIARLATDLYRVSTRLARWQPGRNGDAGRREHMPGRPSNSFQDPPDRGPMGPNHGPPRTGPRRGRPPGGRRPVDRQRPRPQ